MNPAATARQPRPASASEPITVRRMNFEFGDDIPEFWFDGNPFLTALLTSLSVSFPAGERYFIDSVRHYEADVNDPGLRRRIRAFIGQEANHRREHTALNTLMERKGYPARAMEDMVADRMGWVQKNSSPEQNLARTAALEHFTAIMAGAFLDHPVTLEKMHPALARIWAWHAIEEVEHRSVAFDVYKATVNDEALRRRTMRKVTLLFTMINTVRTLKLLRVSGNLFNLKAWAQGVNLLWGWPGVFRRIIPRYLAYYRRDFHPSRYRHDAEMREAKRRYLGDRA
ncbi:MAG TPA: metal-dependent hydrolase [Gammaproteobacteria bacterium]|nr:metal-dependent hydrolase [Gammaproteobacteria bacterium]